jgi:hypothetical protein
MPYAPTIIITSTPAIQVSMVGSLTYEEFQQSLNSFQLKVQNVFLESLGYQQLNQSYLYQIYDSDGRQVAQSLKPKVDPYQNQPALYLDLSENDIILNGQSSVSFNMFPGENLVLMLCCKEVNVNDYFPAKSGNFDKGKDSLGNLDLFENYTDCL